MASLLTKIVVVLILVAISGSFYLYKDIYFPDELKELQGK